MNAPGEKTVAFDCEGDRLLGIVSAPAQPGPLGVVIVVGGPQYRAGSHRQFVLLARALAAGGHAAMRFDYRGMGDSEGAPRSFEQADADIAAAIGALRAAQPAVEQVVLWGLCDGASAALLYLHCRADARVTGLVLVNPWLRSAASLARTHVKHYYWQRLREKQFWQKLFSGEVAFAALVGLLHNVRTAWGGTGDGAAKPVSPFQERMAQAWTTFTGPRLLLLSQGDLTAREFIEFTATHAGWKAALQRRPPDSVTLADADHTCSTPAAHHALVRATLHWLSQATVRA